MPVWQLRPCCWSSGFAFTPALIFPWPHVAAASQSCQILSPLCPRTESRGGGHSWEERQGSLLLTLSVTREEKASGRRLETILHLQPSRPP